MYRKIMLGFLAVVMAGVFSMGASAETMKGCEVEVKKAQDDTQQLVIYQHLASPLVFSGQMGDELKLEVINRSGQDVQFSSPVLGINEEIEKNSTEIITVSLDNPPDESIWFNITQPAGGDQYPGVFLVSDFQPTIAIMPSGNLESAFLYDIINYDSTPQPYRGVEDRAAGVTESGTADYSSGDTVRGYW